MPNNSIASIKTALNTHLSAVSELKQVVIGRSFDPSSGYPFCRFYLVGVGSEAITNQPSDYRTYRFAIDIFQEISAQAKADAETDFENAVDAVLDKLNVQWQIKDGSNVATVDNSIIDSSFIVQTEPPFGPCVYLQLLLQCKTLIY